MTSLKIRKKIFLSSLFVFCAWLLGFLWFTQQIPQVKNATLANNEFTENSGNISGNVIVVLTGGSGRLEYGLQLLAEHKGKTLFISGAGENVTVSDILHQATDNFSKKINKADIILGHEAENTIGNAQEIKNWLKNNPAHNIILVTSNYHIPRSMLELSYVLPSVSITPAPVIADDNEMVLSEYHKYIASKLRHLFVSATEKK